MNIDINGVSITLTQEQLDQVAKHLAKPTYPPKGTICWVWNSKAQHKSLRIANGNGAFYSDETPSNTMQWRNYEVIPMGILFSDTSITSSQITPDMHKQLALCWDNTFTTTKQIRVIDANTSSTFVYDGDAGGVKFDSYALCTTPIGNLPKMYRDMIDACQD